MRETIPFYKANKHYGDSGKEVGVIS